MTCDFLRLAKWGVGFFMKVIFLDIDGVLNVIPQGHDKFGAIFHKHFVENLRIIIEKTGAKIVVSSTWRMSGLRTMQAMWKERSLPGEVIDITPDCAQIAKFGTLDYYEAKERGYEIEEWLKGNKVDKYVIIDDDSDMLENQMPSFVKCSDNLDHEDCVDIGYGLTKKCAQRVIEILNN